jgi:membrane-bound lytic murein transglycosylase D
MYVAGVKLKITNYAQRLIQSEINQLTSHPRFFQKKLARIKVYMPIIKKILRSEHIPADFRFLPILESSLIANAVSSSNAVGYWQFKEESALEVGIQIDENVDERLNIVTATQGATRYLNRNHLFFKNWLHTLLSYNLGFAGTQEYLDDLYVNYQPTRVRTMTIDGNTHWYIRRFIAHKLVFEKPLSRYIATSTRLKYFTLRKSSSLQQIARKKRVSIGSLRMYNQWLKSWHIPDDKPYTIILPLKN